jgi:hypothetical protein
MEQKLEFFKLLLAGKTVTEALAEMKLATADAEKFLSEENVSLEDVTQATADAVVKKLEEAAKKAAPTAEPKAVDADELIKKMSDVMDQKLEKFKKDLPTDRKFLHQDPNGGGASQTPTGRKLAPWEQEAVDFLASGLGSSKAKSGNMFVKHQIGLKTGDLMQIGMARKAAGLADLKNSRGQKLALFGARGFEALGRKALDSTANDGAEWIPTNLSEAVMVRMGELTGIVNEFPQFIHKSATQKLPLITTRPTLYYGSAVTSTFTESSPGTNEAELASKKFMAMTSVYDDTDYDTIVSLIPYVVDMLAECYLNGIANAIMNGDTTATHQDADIEAVTSHHAKAWKGLRKYSLAVSALKKDFSNTLSATNIEAILELMGKYSTGPRAKDCGLLVGVKNFRQIGKLDAFAKYNEAGANMTMFGSTLPPLSGVPFYMESQQREDVNASGVQDGATTDKAVIQAVNFNEFILGHWKEMEMETDRDAANSKNDLYLRARLSFTPKETPSATIATCAVGYNVPTS